MRVLVATLLLLLPSAAPAAVEEGDASSHFIWEAVNLLLLIGVLVYFARKPVQSYLLDRRSSIEQNITSSKQLLDDAEGRLSEWNERAAQLDTEAARIMEIARSSAEQERERILAEAERTAEGIRRGARGAVDRELRRARKVLRDEAADLAIELAGKILKEQVTDSDRARLVDEFVTRIEQGAGTQSGGRA